MSLGKASKTVCYVEQYFHPEGWNGAEITQGIVEALTVLPINIKVICGSRPYISPENNSKYIPSSQITILRLIDSLPRKFIFSKTINSLILSLDSLIKLLTLKQLDLIIVQTNPPPIIISAAIASFVRRKPLLIIAMDLYPEVLKRSIASNSFLVRIFFGILENIFNTSYRSANSLVALGPIMKKFIVAKGIDSNKIHVISNWATGNLSINNSTTNLLEKKLNLMDKFVISYSGNIGAAHELDTIINVSYSLHNEINNLSFFLACNGRRREYYYRLINNHAIRDQFILRDLIPNKELNDFFRLSNLSIVSIRPGYEGLVVPSKALGLLARGVPILYIGPASDVSDLIYKSNSGRCFLNGDIKGITTFIFKVYNNFDILRKFSDNGIKYYQKNLSYNSTKDKYSKLVSNILY